MGRDIDIDDREQGSDGPSRTSGSATSPITPERQRAEDPRGTLDHALSRGLDGYRVVRWRDRAVALSPSEGATLRTLGTFRTVSVADLARHRFGDDRTRCARELRRLERHRLIETRTLAGRHGGRALPVVTLTREGHAFTRQHLAAGIQRYHYGLVRPKEQAHDAALYRMALKEADRLSREGATIRRVVLDAELKGQLAALRNRPEPTLRASGTAEATSSRFQHAHSTEHARTAPDTDVRTRAAADALHLTVVDGHVQIPDLRLEYETRHGDLARVDLELATEHYRADQVAAKAQAGFTIYAPASQTGRLSAALHDRGLVAQILSL
jgi:DNA-binding MarR family transcriptional regulator